MISPRHNFSGFTLVELVLVMLLLTIMVGLIVPSFSGVARGRQAPNIAYQLVTLTQWAHTQAMGEGRTYTLNITPAEGKYQLTADEGSRAQKLEGRMGQTFTVAEGISISSDLPTSNGQQVIRFYPNGRTDPARIRISREKQVVEVVCLSAAESFHLATDAELGTKK